MDELGAEVLVVGLGWLVGAVVVVVVVVGGPAAGLVVSTVVLASTSDDVSSSPDFFPIPNQPRGDLDGMCGWGIAGMWGIFECFCSGVGWGVSSAGGAVATGAGGASISIASTDAGSSSMASWW